MKHNTKNESTKKKDKELETRTEQNVDPYQYVYAVIYAKYISDSIEDESIYQIILAANKDVSIPREMVCYPIVVTREQNKPLFDSAIHAVANQLKSFEFEGKSRSNESIRHKYSIIKVSHIDESITAKYKPPIDIDLTDKCHTIYFFYSSNKCFRQKHKCTLCMATIKPIDQYSYKPLMRAKVIHCDMCDIYFTTKEMFDDYKGCAFYYLNAKLEPGFPSKAMQYLMYGYRFHWHENIFDDFEEQTAFNCCGYATNKSTSERRSIIMNTIRAGRFTPEQWITYFHEIYLDHGLYSRKATQTARDDLHFVRDFYLDNKDRPVNGKLSRP